MHTATATPTLYAFAALPPFARGLARDMRVRWALEEIGQAYTMHLISFEEVNTPAYRRLQPFGQIPVLQDGDLELFESGAIVHHLAAASPALMPTEQAGRARTLCWMFAALNSVEPSVMALLELDRGAQTGAAWAEERRPAVEERVRKRLGELARHLEGRNWLEAQFSAGDLLMASVLRMLTHNGHASLVEAYPSLDAWLQRCLDRPAFKKALADHLAVYAET